MKYTKDNPESRTFLVTVTRATERTKDGSWNLDDLSDEKMVQQHLTSKTHFNKNARVEVVATTQVDQEVLL